MTVRRHLERMTLREKCGQMVFSNFNFADADYDRVMKQARVGVGGVCVFGGSIFDVAPFVNSLQRAGKFPLLLGSDFERGCGQQVSGATVLPSNMAVGAAGSEELAELKGKVTAVEARAVGIPWIFAPVLDLNLDPRNPIINTRSFGEDPEKVAALAGAFVRGVHAGKALACAKHFPGHGDVAEDSHAVLPVVDRPIERLRATELAPYESLVLTADSIMTAHLLVRAIDAENPVTLSKAALGGLLRGELFFEGLICTDALTMAGIAKFCPDREAVERAARAGADAILCPPDVEGAVGALEEAVKAGRLAEAALDRAAERILELKDRMGLFVNRQVDIGGVERVAGCREHREAAQKIADAAVTLVRGPGRLDGPAAVLAVRDASAQGDLGVFERELAARGKAAADADRCVAAVFFSPHAQAARTGLPEELVAQVRAAQARHKEVVVVSFGSPYVLRHFPDVAGYVCAYGEDEASQRAAAKALAGEIDFRGRLPVTLA
jgi:beta-N-acetylhexosaminidase